MANSAGNVPGNDQSKTDRDRGASLTFNFNKAGRKTNRVGTLSSVPNTNTVDGNATKANDPRFV